MFTGLKLILFKCIYIPNMVLAMLMNQPESKEEEAPALEEVSYTRSAPKPLTVNSCPNRILFVGDSRTVGMQMSLPENNHLWICEVGKGYNWLMTVNDTGRTPAMEIEEYLTGVCGATMVFNMGVNDLGNADRYIAYINELCAAHPDDNIIYMSVNPVDEVKSEENKYTVTNDMIAAFNDKVSAGLSEDVCWLNSCLDLLENGFESWDGLHYTPSTYKHLYNLVTDKLN